jgi:DNA-binding response OmpR family regulator
MDIDTIAAKQRLQHSSMNEAPKVLLVDDREDNLLSMEAILKTDGYQFITAYSGNEALKILNRESDFAIILMDVKMPTLSGFDTATLIYERESLKHIPIIFITANYYGEENLFKGYQSGGIDYIFKPINPEILRAKVSIFIELYRKNRLLIAQDQKLLEINLQLSDELNNVKAAALKLKVINYNLRKKITDLESLMTVSQTPAEESEFVLSDLNQLVDNLLNDMKDEVNGAVISVSKLPSVCISPRLIGPVLKNLIHNTLSRQEKNISPIVCIRSERSSHEISTVNVHAAGKSFWNIFVEDHCNEFSQEHPGDTTAEHCDTEFGLVFCKQIIEQHKGSISAKAKGRENLTYIISLPAENQTY